MYICFFFLKDINRNFCIFFLILGRSTHSCLVNSINKKEKKNAHQLEHKIRIKSFKNYLCKYVCVNLACTKDAAL